MCSRVEKIDAILQEAVHCDLSLNNCRHLTSDGSHTKKTEGLF